MQVADGYSGLVTACGVMMAHYPFTGESPARGRLEHLYLRGAFRCKDGYLAPNMPDDGRWGGAGSVRLLDAKA